VSSSRRKRGLRKGGEEVSKETESLIEEDLNSLNNGRGGGIRYGKKGKRGGIFSLKRGKREPDLFKGLISSEQ